MCGPEGCETSRRSTVHCVTQRPVPVRRPSTHDQPELVEDLIKKLVEFIRVRFELRGGVPYTSVEIIAMRLDKAVSSVDERQHAFDLVWRAHYRRRNACVFQRPFYQTIEVGRYYNPDIAPRHQICDCPVRCSRLFGAFFAFLLIWLEVSTESRLPTETAWVLRQLHVDETQSSLHPLRASIAVASASGLCSADSSDRGRKLTQQVQRYLQPVGLVWAALDSTLKRDLKSIDDWFSLNRELHPVF